MATSEALERVWCLSTFVTHILSSAATLRMALTVFETKYITHVVRRPARTLSGYGHVATSLPVGWELDQDLKCRPAGRIWVALYG